MSILFDASDSMYLTNSVSSLTSYKRKNAKSEEEIYASNPRENKDSKLYDNRLEDELMETIDLGKIARNVANCMEKNAKEVWIVISCGGFAPIHTSHISLVQSALERLTKEGEKSYGMMGIFIPNNAKYTAHKLRERGKDVPNYLEKEHIINSAKVVFEDYENMDLCTIDLDRESWCEWFVCVKECINLFLCAWNIVTGFKESGFFREGIEVPELKFSFVGGEDLIRSKNGLHKGVNHVDFLDKIFMVPREVEACKKVKYPLSQDVEILDYIDLTMSSTKVRQLIEDKNYEELEKALHPKTLAYLTMNSMFFA